jgi:hypothetical protein
MRVSQLTGMTHYAQSTVTLNDGGQTATRSETFRTGGGCHDPAIAAPSVKKPARGPAF